MIPTPLIWAFIVGTAAFAAGYQVSSGQCAKAEVARQLVQEQARAKERAKHVEVLAAQAIQDAVAQGLRSEAIISPPTSGACLPLGRVRRLKLR